MIKTKAPGGIKTQIEVDPPDSSDDSESSQDQDGTEQSEPKLKEQDKEMTQPIETP